MTRHEPPATSHVLSGPIRKPRSGTAKQLVVLLHGWGADGPNLIDLGAAFSQVLPDAQFIAPNAPQPCEANPYGYQWFSLMDRQPQHLLSGARGAEKIVNHFLDAELARLKLDNGKLALVGFSQGTMVGLQVALRRTPAIAALVGFSGALIAPDMLAKEIAARPPVCLVHGEADEVVPFHSLKAATDALNAHGVPVESHKRPFLGHSIDMEGMKIAAEFLGKVF
ncbi:MAG: alpha/beta fold hydrolase [Pseudomonadota bacterium]|nr:alpha/beta fold hydrolase [Pseudomonadota bacterium]MDE3038378.1 alpha/beta fold hydrolase [Pseudomonadota bacterium]